MYLLFVIFGFASVVSRSSSSSAYPSQLFVSNISADFIKLVWSLCVENSFYALFIPHTCSWTTLSGLLPTEVGVFFSFFFIRVIFHSFESCPEGAEYASRVSSVHVDWGQIFSRAQICWLQAVTWQHTATVRLWCLTLRPQACKWLHCRCYLLSFNSIFQFI